MSGRQGRPIFPGAKGGRMDRYAADRMVKRLARGARLPSASAPQSSPLLHHRCLSYRLWALYDDAQLPGGRPRCRRSTALGGA
ncbi:MAG TPA: hypothetical protein VGW38_19965, partial [Chloroflexota bacterium]|nr:hypothetical protein [Chloroflexota bacterium]